jgi:O-acetyl-ADP-ribose deacetylase (regulator of RNase III)
MSIKIISFNKEWNAKMCELFHNEQLIIIESCDIKDVLTDNSCFVSSANSLGFIDGGIDLVLSHTIFPVIDSLVREHIKQFGIISSLDHPYLPIGSSISVSYDESFHLIVTPMMFLVHDVRETENLYHSFYSALKMWEKLCKIHKKQFNLVVTSHCYGIGKIPDEESTKQIYRAYNDFIKGFGPQSIKEINECILLPRCDMSQPNNLDNMEIKTLYMSHEEYIKNL